MRRVLIGCMALLLSSGLGFAQAEKGKAKGKEAHAAHVSADAGVKDAIKKMEDELRQASIKGDVSVMEKYLSDDAVSISGATGKAFTKQQMIERVKNGTVKYSQINVSNEDVATFGNDVAIAHGEADVKITMDGRDTSGKYHYSRTWVKRNGKWQAVWFQASKMQ